MLRRRLGWRSWLRPGRRSGRSARRSAGVGGRPGATSAYLRRVPPPPPKRSPLRLSLAEREEISRGLAGGESLRSIARRLGRAPSTVSREVAANGGARRYRACVADRRAVRAMRRPKAAKLAPCPRLRAVVEAKLELRWSPQQISGWLVRGVPRRPGDARVARDDLSVAVRAVPRRAAQGTDPLSAHGHARPAGPRGHSADERPRPAPRHASTSANDPPKPTTGPCPATGKATCSSAKACSAIATLVERKSRFVHARRAARRSHRRRRRRRARRRRSPSCPTSSADRSPGTKARRWPPTPASPSTPACPSTSATRAAPGSAARNENTNGLLRQYFPKRTELAHYTQADLDAVAAELNGRPRQTLGWRSPSQALDEALR